MIHLSHGLLAAASGEEGGGGHKLTSIEGMFVYFAITVAIILFLCVQMKKGIGPRVFTTRLARYAEHAYLFVEKLCVGIIGPHGKKYMPMMCTFWLVIFFANLIALVSPYSVTADLGFNLGLALVAIGYVQYEGIRANGFFGHISHFAGPKLTGPMVIISGMIFVIELLSETMKNVSLSLRLFGNIEGGHLVTDALNNEVGGKFLIPLGNLALGFPFGTLLLPIKLMTCLVQAMIFTLLTCVYLSLVTAHHDDHGHDHAGEPAPAH